MSLLGIYQINLVESGDAILSDLNIWHKIVIINESTDIYDMHYNKDVNNIAEFN